MCIANRANESLKKDDDKKDRPDARDVPLGSGLADSAKLSILSRRERIREAVEGD